MVQTPVPFLLFSWHEKWLSEAAGSQPEGYHDVRNSVLPLQSCFHCAPLPEAPLGNTAKAEPRPEGRGSRARHPSTLRLRWLLLRGEPLCCHSFPARDTEVRGLIIWVHLHGHGHLWGRLTPRNPGGVPVIDSDAPLGQFSGRLKVLEGKAWRPSAPWRLLKGLRRWALCDEGRRGLVLSLASVHHSFVWWTQWCPALGRAGLSVRAIAFHFQAVWLPAS